MIKRGPPNPGVCWSALAKWAASSLAGATMLQRYPNSVGA